MPTYYVVNGKIVDTPDELVQHLSSTPSSIRKIEADSRQQAEIMLTGTISIETGDEDLYTIEVKLLHNGRINVEDDYDIITVAHDQITPLIEALILLKPTPPDCVVYPGPNELGVSKMDDGGVRINDTIVAPTQIDGLIQALILMKRA